MISDVTKRFNKELKKVFGEQEEVCNFMLNHPNKKIAINKCCEQIKIGEHKRLNKFGFNQYQDFIKATAHIFSKAALEAKRQELMSEAAKKLHQQKQDRIKTAENTMKELEKDATDETIKVYQGGEAKT